MWFNTTRVGVASDRNRLRLSRTDKMGQDISRPRNRAEFPNVLLFVRLIRSDDVVAGHGTGSVWFAQRGSKAKN